MGLEAPKTKNTAALQDRYDLQGCGFVFLCVSYCLFILLSFAFWLLANDLFNRLPRKQQFV